MSAPFKCFPPRLSASCFFSVTQLLRRWVREHSIGNKLSEIAAEDWRKIWSVALSKKIIIATNIFLIGLYIVVSILSTISTITIKSAYMKLPVFVFLQVLPHSTFFSRCVSSWVHALEPFPSQKSGQATHFWCFFEQQSTSDSRGHTDVSAWGRTLTHGEILILLFF